MSHVHSETAAPVAVESVSAEQPVDGAVAARGSGSVAAGGGRGFDLVVVGAGIVGLGAAYAAVRRGLTVCVIEQGTRPTGSSIRNFGHLCIGAQAGEARVLAEAGRETWLRLSRDADFWLRESGTLIAARHTDELALIEAAAGGGAEERVASAVIDGLAAGSDDAGTTSHIESERTLGNIELFDANEFAEIAPVSRKKLVGGARILGDLQTDPRTAAERIIALLESLGVAFMRRTAVTSVSSGAVSTSRGAVPAGQVILAVNHDIDRLLPDVAAGASIERCVLDMMRVQLSLRAPLDAPLLTGWSLLRYGRFDTLAEVGPVRERLHAERPDLAAIDLNQMYTQLPDGSMIVGDTHHRDSAPLPFQAEDAQQALIDEALELFGVPSLRVIERWQGMYATGSGQFLDREVLPGVRAIAATTGIGMTCGFGLAERAVGRAFDAASVAASRAGTVSAPTELPFAHTQEKTA